MVQKCFSNQNLILVNGSIWKEAFTNNAYKLLTARPSYCSLNLSTKLSSEKSQLGSL